MHFHYKQDPNIYQKLTPSPYDALSMDLNWPSVVCRIQLFLWIAETPSCWQPWCYQHCRRVSWQRLFSWFPVALLHCTPFDQCLSSRSVHFRARSDLQLWGVWTAPMHWKVGPSTPPSLPLGLGSSIPLKKKAKPVFGYKFYQSHYKTRKICIAGTERNRNYRGLFIWWTTIGACVFSTSYI